jgi:hypothetical protein
LSADATAASQFGDRVRRVFAVGGDIHRVGEGRVEGRGGAAVACVQLTVLLDHEAEAMPRIGVGEPSPTMARQAHT